jgi:murein DD-endopeptidase MepM/ murein hydrolase activator NlpD
LALLATAALASGPMLSGAVADDLHDKKNHAHEQVKAAQADLEDSSKALSAAYSQLKAAQTKLTAAQRTLAQTQGQLTAARVLDAQMQAKLVRAEAALKKAKVDLATGIANVKSQRQEIGRLAAADYQLGDPRLMRFSAMIDAQDPEELATQFNTIDNLMDKQTSMLDRFKAAKALLVVQKAKVEETRGQVAAQRQAAAVNLARKQALEKRAATYSVQVAALVTQKSGAAADARRIRAEDARKLHASKAKEARIRKLILARARKQHGGYQGQSNGFLFRPVPGYITSPYGWRRHPIYGYWGLHDGVDFHAPCGTPERAGAAGTIIEEYYSDVWGNRLYLDVGRVNGKSMTLIYNHISSYRRHTGDHVGRGEVLAYAGTTGWSTACHLHFTVMLNGTAVDPENYL